MKLSISKSFIVCMFFSSLVLAGCTTQNPYTGQDQYSDTSKGALFGTLAGAAIGQAAGGDTESTLIGAGLGAVAGTGIGTYMDKQEAELRRELQATGVQIQKYGNNIKLIMPGNVTFATNSSNINSGFYRTLGSVAIILKKYNKTFIEIGGFTDSTGDDKYNFTLSENRARSVASYLQGQGIMPNRMIVRGYGENRPIASNTTSSGRAMNRRVEIQIRPM
jgi:outer membrane protein OmpA-like peptidoglycan-associated protein